MKIVEPSFELLSPMTREEGIQSLRKIEAIARVSHRSEDKQTDDSYLRFLQAVVMQKGDWSVTEHASATVLFRVDRGCTHEIVRHRLFSFTQESTRFVNYGKREMEFIIPEGLEGEQFTLKMAFSEAEDAYLEMLEKKFTPQQARGVLPNSLASTLIMTGNFRSWRHFLTMRTTKETHPDLKRVTIPLLTEFQQRVPILFDDVEPNQKQSISLSKPK
jgi:thymidylate synthase (FAD)